MKNATTDIFKLLINTSYQNDDTALKGQIYMAENKKVFIRKKFDFPVPKEVENAITELENAVLTNSTMLDIYLDEFKSCVRFNTGGESGMTDEQADEVMHYYYRKQYLTG